MPDMRTKVKKSTRPKDEAPAADCPPKKKTKKKLKKSVLPEDAAPGAAAAAGHASSLLKVEEVEKEGEKEDEKKVTGKKMGKGKKTEKKMGKGKKMRKGKMPDGDEDRWPSLYMVIRHAVRCPAYSLFKVTLTPKTGDHPVPAPCRVKYLDAEHDMSFAAVSSDQRSWIVGVGGFPARLEDEDQPHGGRGETIVFDCKSETVAKGPRPTESKFSPVVIAVGEKVYALARMPSIWLPPDFPPWFEVLDVSAASCIDGKLTDCSWCPLPSPPLFPIMNQEGSRVDAGPPIVEVESYAVVGNYILLSIVRDPFTERDAGTVAFDISAEEWRYVDREKNLPFIGQAVPYGGGGDIYLGKSRSKGILQWNELTAYSISVTKTNSSLVLSILEVPATNNAMASSLPMISGQFFSRLGNGIICAVRCCTETWTSEEETERDNICIDFYSAICAGDEEAELQRAGKIVLCSSLSKYFFRVKEPAYQLIPPTLVSALWMDVI